MIKNANGIDSFEIAMKELTLFISDYLKGKSVYAPLRRVLSLLFSISTASFFYERIYGQYSWYSFADYKAILDFFIKGHFFIPFCVFLITVGIIHAFSSILFITISHFRTTKWEREIIAYQIKKENVQSTVDKVIEVSGTVTPIKFNYPMLVELAKRIKENMTDEMHENLKKELAKPKLDLEASFHTCTKLIIAISIYFGSLPQFGILLYLTEMIIVLITMYLLWIAHCFLGVLPTLSRKFNKVVEQFISDHSI
jgi:hypothetical protein